MVWNKKYAKNNNAWSFAKFHCVRCRCDETYAKMVANLLSQIFVMRRNYDT